MNSRQRVIAATNFKEPDKVPIDLNGTNCTALTYPAYNNLRRYLELEQDKEIDISDIMQGTVRSKDDILALYQVDTRTIFLKDSQIIQNNFLPYGSYYDEFGARWKPVLYYYDCIERPLSNATSIKDLEKIKWEYTSDKTRIRGVYEKQKIYLKILIIALLQICQAGGLLKEDVFLEDMIIFLWIYIQI